MFSRRALQSPILRQFGRGLPKPRNTARTTPSIQARLQPFHLQTRRPIRLPDDRPAYEYDPNKQHSARPLFTPRMRRDVGRSGAIIVVLGVGGGIYYISNIEEVPFTSRKRFNCYSKESVAEQGEMMYKMILNEYGNRILPASDPRSRQVQRVLNRLLSVDFCKTEGQFEVFVIDDPKTLNAFVLPGNKVFVYTGILPICRNDDGLAAVLGHEIAHNIASHAAERLSQSMLVQGALWTLIAFDVTGIFGQMLARYALDLGVMKPASRTQESEADYIGLLMMAGACYDPQEAVGVWKRMKKVEETQPGIPEFMSTHPSNENRITRIRDWLPEAEAVRSQNDCGFGTQYVGDFIRQIGQDFVRDSR